METGDDSFRRVARGGLTLGCVWILALVLPAGAAADPMDPSLSRLRVTPGTAGCPADGAFCAEERAFESLVSDLTAGFAPPVVTGAASLGVRGFALDLSLLLTPISPGPHWTKASRGDGPEQPLNLSPDGLLAWNRLQVRKGLPFGLEVGAAVGHGLNTSLWSLGAEVRAALFEGYRSGLGALPDVAVRGAIETVIGSEDLALDMLAFDVTLSKPYVVGGQHRLTPLVALQALFAHARAQPIDLTPGASAWDACAPSPDLRDPAGFACTRDVENDVANTRDFPELDQTRIRLFLGLEDQFRWFTAAFTLGLDLTVPRRHADVGDAHLGDLPRSLTLHIALGLRY